MEIVKTNITDQVIEYLKNNIENGNWKLGEKIPSENKLTEILGVSRSSIRVAIQQFIALGALESIQGLGTFVTHNKIDNYSNNSNNITFADCEDINKVLEFRRILEPESCYLAANNASEDTIQQLKHYLEVMSQSIGFTESFVKADMLFHEEICKATKNQLIEKSLREVFDKTAKNHNQMNEIFGYKDGIYFHTQILKAIEEKDAKLARSLMKDHLEQAIKRLSIS